MAHLRTSAAGDERRRSAWWALGLAAVAVVVAVAVTGGDEEQEPGEAVRPPTSVAEDPGQAPAVAPAAPPVDPVEVFAIDDVRAQAEVQPGLFMAVGVAPGPMEGRPVLTLGGAVREGESWTQTLDAQFGPCANPDGSEEVQANRALRLVPGSEALVVRCQEEEDRIVVYVFAAPPGRQPGVVLQISCGRTDYELRGSRLAILPTDQGGDPQPALEFTLDGPILDTPGRLPSSCDRLDD